MYICYVCGDEGGSVCSRTLDPDHDDEGRGRADMCGACWEDYKHHVRDMRPDPAAVDPDDNDNPITTHFW